MKGSGRSRFHHTRILEYQVREEWRRLALGIKMLRIHQKLQVGLVKIMQGACSKVLKISYIFFLAYFHPLIYLAVTCTSWLITKGSLGLSKAI